jgi:hypothetical protein
MRLAEIERTSPFSPRPATIKSPSFAVKPPVGGGYKIDAHDREDVAEIAFLAPRPPVNCNRGKTIKC